MTRRILGCCAAMLLWACTERASTIPPATVHASPARLVLSDSSMAVGGVVDVFARAELPAPALVGSFTVRVRFDTTALRFEGELPLGDGAMRATNASPGAVRVAGVASAGFADGRLAALRFVVLRANGAESLQLVLDEMHTVARAEVQP